jgi:hypothetical protein
MSNWIASRSAARSRKPRHIEANYRSARGYATASNCSMQGETFWPALSDVSSAKSMVRCSSLVGTKAASSGSSRSSSLVHSPAGALSLAIGARTTSARTLTRVLLKADEGPGCTDTVIAESVEASVPKVAPVRQRYVSVSSMSRRTRRRRCSTGLPPVRSPANSVGSRKRI